MFPRLYMLVATVCFTLALLQFGVMPAQAGSNNCGAKTPPACNGDCTVGVCNPDVTKAGTPCICI